MKLPATQIAFDDWMKARRERRAPERADIDAAGSRKTASRFFVLQVHGERPFPRDLPVSVSSDGLDALLGRGLSGSAFLDLWAEDDQALVRTAADSVLESMSPALLGGEAHVDDGTVLAFELLLLPLRDGGQTHALLLGSLAVANMPSASRPHRVQSFTATTWRMLDAPARRTGVGGTQGIRRFAGQARPVARRFGPAASTRAAHEAKAGVKAALARWFGTS